MRKLMTTLLLAFLAMDPAWAAGLTEKQIGDLEEGETVMIKLDADEGKGYIGGTSYGLMDHDIDKAWSAIQDPKVYPKIYPTTLESELVEAQGNKSIVKMVQGNQVVNATYYLQYKSYPGKYKLTWKLDDTRPHDIADCRGYFRFSRYEDGRTLMKMTTVLDLGNAAVEKLFGDKIAKGILKMPKKFRKFLDKPVAAKYNP